MQLTSIVCALAMFHGVALASSVKAERAAELKATLRGKLGDIAKDDCDWTACPNDNFKEHVSAMKCPEKFDTIYGTALTNCQCKISPECAPSTTGENWTSCTSLMNEQVDTVVCDNREWGDYGVDWSGCSCFVVDWNRDRN